MTELELKLYPKMDENLMQKYNEIGDFIKNIESRIKNILDVLNWNESDTKKEFNSSADKLPVNSKLRNDDLKNQLYPESIMAKNSLKLDDKLLSDILKKPKTVPKGVIDNEINFTREEKLKVYEFVISKTEKLTEPEFSSKYKSTSNAKTGTFADIVDLKCDLKRRRNTKIRETKAPRLSLNEELRNLIYIQMEALIEYKQNQNLSLSDKHKQRTSQNDKANFKDLENNKNKNLQLLCKHKSGNSYREAREKPTESETIDNFKSHKTNKNRDGNLRSSAKTKIRNNSEETKIKSIKIENPRPHKRNENRDTHCSSSCKSKVKDSSTEPKEKIIKIENPRPNKTNENRDSNYSSSFKSKETNSSMETKEKIIQIENHKLYKTNEHKSKNRKRSQSSLFNEKSHHNKRSKKIKNDVESSAESKNVKHKKHKKHKKK